MRIMMTMMTRTIPSRPQSEILKKSQKRELEKKYGKQRLSFMPYQHL